jgi:hypothetical protein
MFSWLARVWFRSTIHDVHCGMRGFRTALVRELDLRCTGMEFASEMVIKAALCGARMGEVPITLRPDGRAGRASHLRTFRDGWRHLRFYLLYSPRWLFLAPGLTLIAIGLLGYGLGLPALRIGRAEFDVHTLLFSSLAITCGFQAVLFGVHARAFATSAGLLPRNERFERARQATSLERGVVAGVCLVVLGLVLLMVPVVEWWRVDFGPLDYRRTMRWAIPGVTAASLGFEMILSSFFLGLLGLARR